MMQAIPPGADPPRWSAPGLPHRILCLAILGLGIGCGFELPEAPYFETNISIPLGRERVSGWDLADSELVIGDSTGNGPLIIFFEGEIDSVRLGDRLDIRLPASQFEAPLDRISLRELDPIAETFLIGELVNLPIPTGGDSLVVPPFVLPAILHPLSPRHTFNWLRLHSGSLNITLTNLLSVPIGIPGNARASLGVRLVDRSDGAELFRTQLESMLDAGEQIELITPLGGTELHRLMDIEIFGESPGSGGRRVWVSPEDGIGVGAIFEEVEPDSVIAAVGAQSVFWEDTIHADLAGEIGIVGGTVATGSVPITLINEIPLSAQGALRFSEILEEGVPLSLEVELPAGQSGLPGRYHEVIELSGRTVRSLDGEPLEQLGYTLELQTEASQGVVSLGRRQRITGALAAAPVAFGSVEARPDQIELELPRTTTPLELPDEVRSFELVEASLRLVLENGTFLPGLAAVTLRGVSGKEPVELPIELEIAAGEPAHPVESSVLITETGSRLLDLIRARPRTLEVEGAVRIGSGEITRIGRDDWIRGRYEVSAPLRIRVGRLDHDVEEFDFSLSEDAQARIREDVIGVAVSGQIVNHFPLAAQIRIMLASTSERLDEDPEIELAPIAVGRGVVDPGTGRVTQAVSSEFEVALPEEETLFFARDRVFGRFSLQLLGDSVSVVTLAATDFAEFSSLLVFRVGIGAETSP